MGPVIRFASSGDEGVPEEMADEIERELERLHAASFAWAMTCCRFDRAEAEEVLQTAYEKTIDGRARFDGRSSLKTWFFSVVRKTAADSRRRRAVARLFLLGAPRPPAIVAPAGEDAAHGARVRAALLALPARQREVLDLVFWGGLSVVEAAEVMGVSAGTARQHYDRGKRALAAALKEEP
jgi:RNA polymerase sigma-70 factor (ECF subfamily)